MNEIVIKEKMAIERFKAFEPQGEPYYVCYSDGKDSDVIRILAELSGVKYELHHNLTTVDAPETIAYIKTTPNVSIDKAVDKDGKHITMWNLIVKEGIPPTRLMRYCCEELKERGGKGRIQVTGVRISESTQRKKNGGLVKILGKPKTVAKYADENNVKYEQPNKGGLVLNMDNDESRRMVEHCYRTAKTMLNPIYDWEENEVWEFLKHYGCESNPLYKCGLKRIGCIGCPMASTQQRIKQFERYPKYKTAYLHAFDKMLTEREKRGLTNKCGWKNADDVMQWWLQDRRNQGPEA